MLSPRRGPLRPSPPRSHSAGPAASEKDGEPEKGTGSPERGEKERNSRERERERDLHSYLGSLVPRGRAKQSARQRSIGDVMKARRAPPPSPPRREREGTSSGVERTKTRRMKSRAAPGLSQRSRFALPSGARAPLPPRRRGEVTGGSRRSQRTSPSTG